MKSDINYDEIRRILNWVEFKNVDLQYDLFDSKKLLHLERNKIRNEALYKLQEETREIVKD